MQKVCASNKAFIRAKKARDSAEMFRYLYVDDKHHFLYCEVPKVGMCTADEPSNMLNVVPESILYVYLSGPTNRTGCIAT